MSVPLDTVKARFTPERQEAVSRRTQFLIDRLPALSALAGPVELTRREMARRLRASPRRIARIERDADLVLSVLREQVKALGGSLDIEVTLPGMPVFLFGSFAELSGTAPVATP